MRPPRYYDQDFMAQRGRINGFHCSSLWRTDTIVFSKLDKPPLSNKSLVSSKPPPLPDGLKINNGGGA